MRTAAKGLIPAFSVSSVGPPSFHLLAILTFHTFYADPQSGPRPYLHSHFLSPLPILALQDLVRQA